MPISRKSASAEAARLAEIRHGKHWRRWGPYLSERQWGTVREDYSEYGTAWDYFPHDHARSRAYRWGEDGIGGFGDDHLLLCLGLALVERPRSDPEGAAVRADQSEGNHGEDVKELYYYLDGTPTHSYMRMLYKYPQAAFPYSSARRGEPAARPGRAGIRADRHRRLRREPLFRCRDRICQGRCRRHPDAGHGPQSRAGSGDAACVAAALGPQYLVVADPIRCGPSSSARGDNSISVDHPHFPPMRLLSATAGRNSCSAKTRPMSGGCWGIDAPGRYFKDGINDYVVNGDTRGGEPGAPRHQGRGALSARACRPEEAAGCARG